MKHNGSTVGSDLAKKLPPRGDGHHGPDCMAQAADAPCLGTLYGAAAPGDHRPLNFSRFVGA